MEICRWTFERIQMDGEERLCRALRTWIPHFRRRVRFIHLSPLYVFLYHLNNRDGRYGLYLDDTLLDGSSARCPTFENEPLCSHGGAKKGGGNVAFECVGLEVWAVGPT